MMLMQRMFFKHMCFSNKYSKTDSVEAEDFLTYRNAIKIHRGEGKNER